MQCDQLIDVILVLGRVIVLILGMLAGVITIYLGWRLYKDSVISKTSGEVNFKSIKIILTSGGPGVFLAVFGAYILITVLNQKVELSANEGRLSSRGFENFSTFAPRSPEVWLVGGEATGKAADGKSAIIDSPKTMPCAIKTTTKKLYTGTKLLTPLEIRQAIDISLHELNERESEESKNKFEYRKAIGTLTELRKNIVE
jgi:hypothetical protein